MENNNKRLGYIDAIKGLCMLLVLIDHSGFQLHPMVDYVEVPSFFIVSGFLYKDLAFQTMWRKKATRLIYPYIFFALLYAVPFILKSFHEGENIADGKALALFFMIPANEPLWFLKALFWIFILYKLLTQLIGLIHNPVLRNVAFMMSIVLFALLGTINNIKTPLFLLTGIPQSIVALPLFAFGNILAKYNVFSRLRDIGIKRWILWGFIVLLWWGTARSGIMMHVASYQANVLMFYFVAIVAFLSVAMFLYVKKGGGVSGSVVTL